jgi:hypothetical protein
MAKNRFAHHRLGPIYELLNLLTTYHTAHCCCTSTFSKKAARSAQTVSNEWCVKANNRSTQGRDAWSLCENHVYPQIRIPWWSGFNRWSWALLLFSRVSDIDRLQMCCAVLKYEGGNHGVRQKGEQEMQGEIRLHNIQEFSAADCVGSLGARCRLCLSHQPALARLTEECGTVPLTFRQCQDAVRGLYRWSTSAQWAGSARPSF